MCGSCAHLGVSAHRADRSSSSCVGVASPSSPSAHVLRRSFPLRCSTQSSAHPALCTTMSSPHHSSILFFIREVKNFVGRQSCAKVLNRIHIFHYFVRLKTIRKNRIKSYGLPRQSSHNFYYIFSSALVFAFPLLHLS